MKPRYLTKSKFKIATECPTKIFYSDKKEYANQKQDDSFLAALAEGGFQVAALAKCYYPDGILIETSDNAKAINITNELLKQDHVVIFEAAVCYQNLFLRADILIKHGNHLQLIEVKSKSVDGTDMSPFMNKKNNIKGEWKSYIIDAAFQKYVLLKAFPDFDIYLATYY